MGLAPTIVPEPGHARPATTRPDRAGARRAPAAPAPPAAARPGVVGPGRGAGAERLPVGGARRPPALGALPRPAPAPAGVAPGRGGQGGPLRRAGRGRALLRALAALGPGLVPAGWTVLVLADRGLWSPRLWKRVRDLGWHPLLRIQRRTTIAPDGGERRPAGALVRPGEAWVGRGRLGRPKGRGLTVTLGSGSSGCATCSREVDRGVGCGSLPSLGPSPRPGWRSPFPARRPELCRIPTPVSPPGRFARPGWHSPARVRGTGPGRSRQ